MPTQGSGSTKRAFYSKAAKVGGVDVDLVARVVTASRDHDFVVTGKRPSIKSNGADDIWVDWYIYKTGTYDLAKDKSKNGVADLIEADVGVQFSDLDGPNNEVLYVRMCTGDVDFVRISRKSTLIRSFGSVAGFDEVFSDAGDKDYDNGTFFPESGAEVFYRSASKFTMGRTAKSPYVINLSNPSYKKADSFDLKCSDFRKPSAIDDLKQAQLGQPVTLSILDNDGVQSGTGVFSAEPPSDLSLDTVSLVAPANATNVTKSSEGYLIGFTVPGEGTWSYDGGTGGLTFTPLATFKGSPTPISYTFKNATNVVSNQAKVAIVYSGLEVVKTATPPAKFAVGELINYTFKVTNTGQDPVTNVTIKDALSGVVITGGPLASLAGQASDTTTFKASYALTADDIKTAENVVSNTATASGTAKDGTTLTSAPSTAAVTIIGQPGLTIQKTAGAPTGSKVGDKITFSFRVENTGNVDLSNVVITDTKLGKLPALNLGNLAPGVKTVTADYKLTQADLVAGKVENTASVTGTPPPNAAPLPVPQPSTVITQIPSPGLSIVKKAGKPSGNAVGSTIAYSFEVKNTGNVTLTDIVVSDKLAGLVLKGGPIASLSPGAEDTKTFSALYTLSQADIDKGSVENTASVTGTPPTGGPVTTSSPTVITPIAGSPGLSIVKKAGKPSGNAVGSTIAYAFEVKNTGNVTLTDISVSDKLAGLVLKGGPLASLAPGASDTKTFSAVYTLTQADIDKGSVENTASVTGTPPTGNPVTTTSEGTVVDIEPAPAMTIAKIADRSTISQAGDKISYTFTISNTGNATLSNLAVYDKVVSASPICQVQQLAPKAEKNCSADYIVTQADLDAGAVRNVATLTGDGPDGKPLIPVESPPVLTVAAVVTQLTVEKKADAPAEAKVGAIIKYTFTVKNEGNVTLSNVKVEDTLPGVLLKGGPIPTLAPGQADSTSFTASYTLTQKDVDAGKVVNKAAATGVHSSKPVAADLLISGEKSVTSPEVTVPVALAAGPALTIVKKANAASGNVPGATLSYDFTITNTGNVTLSNVTVTDPLPGVVLQGQPIKSLAPGEVNTTAYRAIYTLKQSDIDAGSVENTAMVKASPPAGDPIVAQSAKVSTPIAATPKLDIVKSIGEPNGRTAGSSVPYTFKITNSGNVTLVNITITDKLPGIVIKGGPIPILAPGQSDTSTFTATYSLTQADVVAKRVINTAVAHGHRMAKVPPKTATVGPRDVPTIARSIGAPPDATGGPAPLRAPGDEVTSGDGDGDAALVDSGESAAVLEIGEANPELGLVKTGHFNDENGNGYADAEETITYRFVVNNKGTGPIRDVSVEDEGPVFNGRPAANKLSRSEPVLVSIEPGAEHVFTATYKLGQTDVDAAASLQSGVTNKAVARGYSDDGSTSTMFQSPESTSVLNLPAAYGDHDVTIIKQAGLRQIRRGEKAPFTIKVTNNNKDNVGAIVVTDIVPSGFRYVDGSAQINGVAAAPVVAGRNIRFDHIVLGPNAALTIRLQMLALSTAEPGKHTNRAQVAEADGERLAPEASASIEIMIDPVFDCGDIVGKVFDDVNGNGYLDVGEPGLPGVRLATVKGLLITTDSYGRFHVACADLPDKSIGSNFLMKLDTGTLPTGYSVTTENPRVIRLTAGKMSKLNFGASIGHVVALDITDGAFENGQNVLKKEWSEGIDQLIDALKLQPSTLRIFYLVTAARDLATERVSTLQEDIKQRWKHSDGGYELNIETRMEQGQ
ncbi:putative repeat protein (TIGR01451 family) [Phyllobacterium sp. 1468]|uniref:DUF7507 domain-containing protein n=1 Tax=Phyllobacterium sp. 1468 TaxID=2817759 RepID=UPI00286506A0|nr:CARDB domain-containing protein [Phyllobacterium sp. 1468]MDR6631856.1 putative repeat protein (TIGR01451 family) [Phyllobacterium sp. 1468]